ncbi:helix-turn-helix domain-containing protein [Nocardiopsis changdeensis]|uniref:Helix-turn-helix transcriptional regulator n=1 Tax=Nocardiopsis changdeensis TaxID=2831969 RepID=A0ABX8BJL3_9ACTN|nr:MULTISPECIES: helix-turn-helix transcriptional regulator [Nocardiopsis]QUX20603.1 helix-turn-helix transcriptional regulator [Nocardiopsis changdeensis]QYX36534.1 helix-turn-helix domain-containing protein [Nocardiopsis sp. MT53]
MFWDLDDVRAAVSAGDAAETIRLLRRETRLSQTAIARMVGLSQGMVSAIISGGRLISRDRHQQALRGLGAPEPARPSSIPCAEDDPDDLEAILRDGTDRATLAGMEQELAALSAAYVSRPCAPLLPRLNTLRTGALEHYRSGARPRHAHDLLVIVGACELLLAYAAHDGGNPAAALAHLERAARCADFTEHPHLPGWIIGTRALIGDWHPATGTDTLALPGHAPSPQAWARLTAITARAAARRHDRHTARAGLDRLVDHQAQPADTDDLSRRLGGIFAFPDPKRDYYIAATAVLLGDGDRATTHAHGAITAYEAGPAIQRSYGDLALARIDLVSAHLLCGDTDAAHTALEQVARIPASDRIHQLRPALHACAELALNAPIAPSRKREITDRLTALRLPWGP